MKEYIAMLEFAANHWYFVTMLAVAGVTLLRAFFRFLDRNGL